jgi:tRNA (guanine-N7-)-methyltransferase
MKMPANLEKRQHSVRSFVRREGRMTPAQRRALDELWPRYGIDIADKILDLKAIFGRIAPIILEVGFGNGESLLSQAIEHPETDFLGIEVHTPGIGQLLNALDRCALTNVRVIREDAVQVLRETIPGGAVAGIQIFFPDPWPKKRHCKRRLIQPELVERLVKVLTPGGSLHLATDWADYAEHMLAVLEADPQLENLAGPGRFWPSPSPRPQTKFERRGQRLGHQSWDLIYRRIDKAGMDGGI